MVIRSTNTEKISIPNGEIWDYAMPSEDIGISFQTLNGAGPQNGKYLNTVCHEIYFIISGKAVFNIQGTDYQVSANDLVIVEPNTPHSIQAEDLKYITITRPNWYEKQYQEIKD